MATKRPNNTDVVVAALYKHGQGSLWDIVRATGLTKRQVNSTLYNSMGRLVSRRKEFNIYIYYLTGPGVTRAKKG